jgi:hypothetical protein
MKTARFLFIMVAFGAYALRFGYAGESPRQPAERIARENHPISHPSAGPAHGSQERGEIDQKEEKPSKVKEDSHTPEKARQAAPVKSQVKLPSEREPHQPEFRKPSTAAKDGPLMNRTEKPRQQSARLPAGDEALAPRPGVVRNRGATAANVGRVLITSNARYSAGPLAGAAVKRNP